MALAAPWADSDPVSALRRVASRTAGASGRNFRLSAAILVGLMFASFAAATLLQMRRDYTEALVLASQYAAADAAVLADNTGDVLGRLAALGAAYVNAVDRDGAETLVLSTEADRILNIALTDAEGRFISAMRGRPLAAAMLPEALVANVENAGRDVAPYSDPAIGSSPLTLFFQADDEFPPRFVVIPLVPDTLLPAGASGQTALFTADGVTLARGTGWEAPPPSNVLRIEEGETTPLRTVEYDGVRRLIALAPVSGWPLTAASSVRIDDALAGWYASLPLYLFMILGPTLAGLAIAVLMVRAVENADRMRSALAATQAAGGEREPPSMATPSPDAAGGAKGQDAERAKAAFTAHMNQELRAPLGAIIGFSEMIQSGFFGPPGHPKYIEYAGDIAAAARDLHTRLGDILDYAALDNGTHALTLEPVRIGTEIRAAIERIRLPAQARGISVAWELPELPQIHADKEAVKRILTILLSNALRYTPDGGEIRVDACKDENTVVVSLRDNGPGFTPEEALHVGEPYLRFPRPGAEGSGLGLGLAMAMTLARRMGGALRLTGSAGEGTWVELRLAMQ